MAHATKSTAASDHADMHGWYSSTSHKWPRRGCGSTLTAIEQSLRSNACWRTSLHWLGIASSFIARFVAFKYCTYLYAQLSKRGKTVLGERKQCKAFDDLGHYPRHGKLQRTQSHESNDFHNTVVRDLQCWWITLHHTDFRTRQLHQSQGLRSLLAIGHQIIADLVLLSIHQILQARRLLAHRDCPIPTAWFNCSPELRLCWICLIKTVLRACYDCKPSARGCSFKDGHWIFWARAKISRLPLASILSCLRRNG